MLVSKQLANQKTIGSKPTYDIYHYLQFNIFASQWATEMLQNTKQIKVFEQSQLSPPTCERQIKSTHWQTNKMLTQLEKFLISIFCIENTNAIFHFFLLQISLKLSNQCIFGHQRFRLFLKSLTISKGKFSKLSSEKYIKYFRS